MDPVSQATFGGIFAQVFSSKKKIIPKLYYISAFGGQAIRVTKSTANIAETNPVWSK